MPLDSLYTRFDYSSFHLFLPSNHFISGNTGAIQVTGDHFSLAAGIGAGRVELIYLINKVRSS